MAIPSSVNARLFYRAAYARLDDALTLHTLQRTTGTVYLAGYGVECILKSLILSVISTSQEDANAFVESAIKLIQWIDGRVA